MSNLATQDATLAIISEQMPYRGRCVFCGGIDARHRTIDAVASRLIAGDTVAELADDYGLSWWTIEAMTRG